MPNLKEGVVLWEMHPKVVEAIEKADRIFVRLAGRPATITSARDGLHSDSSHHYAGRAIDLRSRDLDEATANRILRELRTDIGPDFDILLESNHYHVEYDPK